MSILSRDLEEIADSSLLDYNAFSNKTFLITGITGLVGSLCAKALLYMNEKRGLNIRVIGIARNIGKAEEIFEGSVKPEFIRMDLLEDAFPQDLNGVDYIIHAAAVTNSKIMVEKPVDTTLTSVYGTDKILRFAAAHDVQSVVYVSSMEAYGTVNTDGKTSEDMLGYIPLDAVRSCYPESKRLCESLCVSYASQYGLRVCCARLAQTFGAGILKTENRVFAQFAKSVLKNEDIVLHTKGESEGNYVYSKDAVLALLFLLQKGEKGNIYNVNNEESHYQIREMAEMVANEISGTIKVVYDIPADANKFGYAPTTKLHLSSAKINQLGWKASVGLKESYERLIAYMKENQFV